MIKFALVIRCDDNDEEVIETCVMIEDMPAFVENLKEGDFERSFMIHVDKRLVIYTFSMAEADFAYLNDEIEKTKLEGCCMYFQEDMFGHWHQIA